MSKQTLFNKLIGSGLATVCLLTACTATATTMAAATSVPATSTPVAPTAMAVPVPTATETNPPPPTATEPPTPTAQLTPEVNPGMNAYCRKGPGTNYYPITFLQAGNNYTIVGQNGLNTWWLIQAPGNITCWMGDPTSVLAGPVWQVSIQTAPPLPQKPGDFIATPTCHSALNILYVEFSWLAQDNAIGYRLYRNGNLLADLGPNTTYYEDHTPPFGVDLRYALEAYNEYGVADRATLTIPECG